MGFLILQLLATVRGAVDPVAAASTGDQGSTAVWLVVAVSLLGSSVVAGLITSVLGSVRTAATARREGYANAVRALIARAEYPYRVRRRVSDAPEVLAALVGRGHDLQEQLAACRTWVTSEHRVVGSIFEKALIDIDATVKPATGDAWDQAPIDNAAGMNLGGWGPTDPWPHLEALERAISFRFGWRRLIPSRLWRLGSLSKNAVRPTRREPTG
jgi:hypothetical protein